MENMAVALLSSVNAHFRKWSELYLIPMLLLSFLILTWRHPKSNKIKNHFQKKFRMITSCSPYYIVANLHSIHDWTIEVISNTVSNTILFKRFLFFGQDILFTTNVKNVEYILKTNSCNFPKGSDVYEAFELLGQAIFTTDADMWRVHRKMANTVFAAKDFKNHILKVNKRSIEDSLLPLLKHFSSRINEGGFVIDLQDVFLRHAFDITLGFVADINPATASLELPHNDLAAAMDDAMTSIFYRYLMPKTWWKTLRWMNMGSEKRMSNAKKIMDRYVTHFMALKRKKYCHATSTEDNNDLLSMYMKIISSGGSSNESENVSQNEKLIRDTTVSYLLAGRDTVASALTWFFRLISKKPDIEEKILEELNKVFSQKKVKYCTSNEGKSSYVTFDYEDLKQMVYLESALYESMRLYPPLPVDRISVLKEDILPDGTMLKPDTVVMFSNYGLGRTESIWGRDCLEYRPERWLDADGKIKLELKSKYFVFNVGPRTCVGKEAALIEIKMAAAAIIFNFKIKEIDEEQNCTTKPSIVLQLKNGFKVKMEERLAC